MAKVKKGGKKKVKKNIPVGAVHIPRGMWFRGPAVESPVSRDRGRARLLQPRSQPRMLLRRLLNRA